jgi:hypothetical protein
MRRAVGILSTAIVPLFVTSVAFAAEDMPGAGYRGPAETPGIYSGTAGTAAGRVMGTGEHTMTGRITDIDKDEGQVSVESQGKEMKLHFPKSALENLSQGDQVTVELAIRPAGGAGSRSGTSGTR